MMPLAMVNKGTFIYLQALGKAGLSTALSEREKEMRYRISFSHDL